MSLDLFFWHQMSMLHLVSGVQQAPSVAVVDPLTIKLLRYETPFGSVVVTWDTKVLAFYLPSDVRWETIWDMFFTSLRLDARGAMNHDLVNVLCFTLYKDRSRIGACVFRRRGERSEFPVRGPYEAKEAKGSSASLALTPKAMGSAMILHHSSRVSSLDFFLSTELASLYDTADYKKALVSAGITDHMSPELLRYMTPSGIEILTWKSTAVAIYIPARLHLEDFRNAFAGLEFVKRCLDVIPDLLGVFCFSLREYRTCSGVCLFFRCDEQSKLPVA